MAWVTPKVNWTANDYYNLEDANRIYGNIEYLKNRLANIFPSDTVTLLLFRQRSNSGYNMYSQFNITLSRLPSLSTYSRGYTTFASSEERNWFNALVLSILWRLYWSNNNAFPYVTGIYVDSAIGTGSSWQPSYTYEGYGYVWNTSAPTIPDYVAALFNSAWWMGGTIPSNYPFSLEMYAGSGKSWTRMDYSEPLQNKKFWTYQDLNSIETHLQNLKNSIDEHEEV